MAQAGLCCPTTRSPRARSHCQCHIAHPRSLKSQCRSGCCSTWSISGCGFWDLSLPLVLLKICTLGSSTQFSHRDCTEDMSQISPGPWWSVRPHTQSKNSAAPSTPVTQISLHGCGQQWGVWEWHAPNSHLGMGSGCKIKQTDSQESSSICTDPSSPAAPTED